MLVKSPTKTRRYRPASHPHQNKYIFPKKPDRGGMPPRDNMHKAKERVSKGYFINNPP
jgi:hypothetical protein